jgi:hypothetical protein
MPLSAFRGVGRRFGRRLAGSGALLVLACLLAPPASAQFDIMKTLEEAVGVGGSAGGLTDQEIGDGLIEALRVGTERVVGQVGALDGYNLDPDIHIPLPGALEDAQKVLRTVGMAGLADDLEVRLNRAAEAAAPEAKELFWEAIGEMTLDDVRGIYDGPDDAATQYFKDKMTPPLAERMQPVVDRSLADVGAIQSYDNMMAQYEAVPFVPDVKADLNSYVVEKAMDGMFYYVAKEEAAIRNNPAARTTELLQKVFGS